MRISFCKERAAGLDGQGMKKGVCSVLNNTPEIVQVVV